MIEDVTKEISGGKKGSLSRMTTRRFYGIGEGKKAGWGGVQERCTKREMKKRSADRRGGIRRGVRWAGSDKRKDCGEGTQEGSGGSLKVE